MGRPGPAVRRVPGPGDCRPAAVRAASSMMRVTRLTAVKNAQRLGDDGHREGAARERLLPVRQPRLRRRRLRPGRQALRLGRRGRELRHPGLRPVPSTRARTPATRAARCGRRTTAARATRWASTARSSRWTRPTAFTPRRPPPTAGWSPTASATRGGSPCRPGTNELWSGDVGGSKWEEVNRIPDVTQVTSPVNRGWPCYEGSFTGSLVQPGWDALDKPLCESLYAAGAGGGAARRTSATRPARSAADARRGLPERHLVGLRHRVRLGAAATTRRRTRARCSSPTTPARASGCWARSRTATPTRPSSSRSCRHAETPVDLVTGPGGDLYYVDYGLDDQGVPTENAAGVHRIVYTGSNAAPTARIVANPDVRSGAAERQLRRHDVDGPGRRHPHLRVGPRRQRQLRDRPAPTPTKHLRRGHLQRGARGRRRPRPHVDGDPADPGRQHRSGAGHGHPGPGRSPGRSGRRSTSRRRPATPSRAPCRPRRSAGTWPSGTAPARSATRTTSAPSRGSRPGASRHPTTSTLRTSC